MKTRTAAVERTRLLSAAEVRNAFHAIDTRSTEGVYDTATQHPPMLSPQENTQLIQRGASRAS